MTGAGGGRSRARGISIPGDVAQAAGIPEDLDADDVGPYTIPSPVLKKAPGIVYSFAAVAVSLGMGLGFPSGMWVIVAVLAALAAYHVFAAWHLGLREGKALEVANRTVGFPVGHASASLGFYGWKAKPIWNVLVFSADEPPARRGLVRIDATDGTVLDHYDELIPVDEL